MSKSLVVVQVEGGVADIRVVGGQDVETLLIDWDNIKEGGDLERAVSDLKEAVEVLTNSAKTMPDFPKGYVKTLLETVNDQLGIYEKDLEAENEQTEKRCAD